MERLESRETPAIFFGGVRVAAADVNGDNVADIVTGAGPGGGPHVRVLSGATGTETAGFYAYDESFRGGVFVAAGDVTGDGIADIVTGAGEGGGPHVKIFDGRTGQFINGFMAFDTSFAGGVRVAVGDITGDGRADIICAAGPGGTPDVRIFSGTNFQMASEFMAYDTKFSGGVYVGVGDINGDGRKDIITGAGAGGAPHVRVFDGTNNQVIQSFLAYDAAFQGGVTVAGGRFSSTGHDDIFTGAGPGGGPHVRVFNGADDTVVKEFYAYDGAFRGGVYVADPDFGNNGSEDIVTGAGPGGGPHVRAWDGGNLSEITGFYAYDPFTGPFGAFGQPTNTTPDTTAPTLTLTTPQPTSPVSTNQTISGTAIDDRAGTVTVTAQVDGSPAQTLTLGANGTFTFTTNLALNGQSDGAHTVTFRATDAANNAAPPRTFAFTLQTTQNRVTLDLAPESDGAVAGNHRTNDATVALIGTAPANSTVILLNTTFSTTADAQGNFRFNNVPLTIGVNSFIARATPAGGGTPFEFVRQITRNSDPTVEGPVAPFHVASGAEATILNLPSIFSDIDVNSLVHFNTTAGGFDVEMFDQQAPLTVQNLLAYIQRGAYANSIFHRSVANFVIQGGNFQFHTNPNRLDTITTDPAVHNEPGISNQTGTIAMAKLGNDPNSATSQFFFNLNDNSRGAPMLDTQNGGFTAFGQVRGDGMTIVNMLAAIPVQNRGGVFTEIPLQNYPAPPAGNFPADTTPANYAFINDVSITRRLDSRNTDALTFSLVSNSNPNLVQAVLANNKLTLNYTAGQSGRATITLRAVDSEGSTIDSTFTVNVGDVTDDTTPPTIAITDPPSGQTVNQNVTIHGTVTDATSGVFSLTASVDGHAPVPVTVATDGSFSFTTTFATDGTQDGAHSIAFVARDQAGNVSAPTTFDLALDSGVGTLTFALSSASDTAGGGVASNNRTNLDTVTLTGTTDPGATVTVVGTNLTATADAQGAFSIDNVPLAVGVNDVTVRATEHSNTRDFEQTIIRDVAPTVASAVPSFHVDLGAEPTFLNLPAIFSDVDVSSLVRFTTPAGTFDLELFDQQTPLTVANFLDYVQSGRYANSIFHRSVSNFVLQGGGFHFVQGGANPLQPITTSPAVMNEPGISNQLGTIAMAKLGGDPNSATSQFFFNLQDNSRGGPMLDTQNGGFTAFGQLRDNGLSVIQGLAAIPTQNRGGEFTEIPLQNYPAPPAGSFPGDTTAANYAFINDVSIVRRADSSVGDALTYSVTSNSNPNLVEVTMTGGKLTLTYAAGQSGRAAIVLRATDAEGHFVESTFVVSVGNVADDTTAPTITIHDPQPERVINSNVTVNGTVSDSETGVQSLTVSIDSGPSVPVTFATDGSFSFTTAFVFDGAHDGDHTVTFVGRDFAGNQSTPVTLTFTVVTNPGPLAFDLDAASDTASSGTAGNHRTVLSTVTLSGTAEPGAALSLAGTDLATTADAQGHFSLPNVPLALGVNALSIRATKNGTVTEFTRNIIRNSDPTVAAPVGNIVVTVNAGPTQLNLPAIFSDGDVNSLIQFRTSGGNFDVELFNQFAPNTVQNFLKYITSGRFDSTIFHSAEAGSFLQGGGFHYVNNPTGNNRLDPIVTDPVIQTETGMASLIGTLAMATAPGQVNSANSEFLFNLVDNSTGGFGRPSTGAAFGQLRTNGLQTVNALAAIPTQNRPGFPTIPLQNYPQPPAGNFPGDTKPFNFAFVNGVSVVRNVDAANGDALTFSVAANTNPSLVTTSIVGGRLQLTYAAGQTGNATITLRAVDAEGRAVNTTFNVTVGPMH